VSQPQALQTDKSEKKDIALIAMGRCEQRPSVYPQRALPTANAKCILFINVTSYRDDGISLRAGFH
jgi:hypothetical protein